ncbi:HEAT repeat-containing protein 4 [Blastocladiella emersonii ATCC 22665]|nr:HEAT repeat-containing protein 4 [Blastocladiella emersonii ATCC 22665]
METLSLPRHEVGLDGSARAAPRRHPAAKPKPAATTRAGRRRLASATPQQATAHPTSLRKSFRDVFELVPAEAVPPARAAPGTGGGEGVGKERVVVARRGAARDHHHAQPLPDKPFTVGTGLRTKHDVAATNALVQAVTSHAFRTRGKSLVHGHHGHRDPPPVADPLELPPRLAIPEPYARRLHDVDAVVHQLERDERYRRALRARQVPPPTVVALEFDRDVVNTPLPLAPKTPSGAPADAKWEIPAAASRGTATTLSPERVQRRLVSPAPTSPRKLQQKQPRAVSPAIVAIRAADATPSSTNTSASELALSRSRSSRLSFGDSLSASASASRPTSPSRLDHGFLTPRAASARAASPPSKGSSTASLHPAGIPAPSSVRSSGSTLAVNNEITAIALAGGPASALADTLAALRPPQLPAAPVPVAVAGPAQQQLAAAAANPANRRKSILFTRPPASSSSTSATGDQASGGDAMAASVHRRRSVMLIPDPVPSGVSLDASSAHTSEHHAPDLHHHLPHAASAPLEHHHRPPSPPAEPSAASVTPAALLASAVPARPESTRIHACLSAATLNVLRKFTSSASPAGPLAAFDANTSGGKRASGIPPPVPPPVAAAEALGPEDRAAADEQVLRVLCGTTAAELSVLLHPTSRKLTAAVTPRASGMAGSAAAVVVADDDGAVVPTKPPPSLIRAPASITAKWHTSHRLLEALVDAVSEPAEPAAAAAVVGLSSANSSVLFTADSDALSQSGSRTASARLAHAAATTATVLGVLRSHADQVWRCPPDRVPGGLKNHTPGTVYLQERASVDFGARGADVTGSSGDLATRATAGGGADANSMVARRRSVFSDFGGGAGEAASRRSSAARNSIAAYSRATSESTFLTSTSSLSLDGGGGGGAGGDEIDGGDGVPAAYYLEASAFLASVKTMGQRFRAGVFAEFAKSELPLDELAVVVETLELTTLPTSLPPGTKPGTLPEAIQRTLQLALSTGFAGVGHAAARLAWITSRGQLPAPLVAPCVREFMGMVESGSLPDQRLAAAALFRLGHVADHRVIAFLCRQLGDVDARARAAAVDGLMSVAPNEVATVARALLPLLDHSNVAVRSDAVHVLAAVAATWRAGYPDAWAAQLVGEPHVVVADGGDKYDAVASGQGGGRGGSLSSPTSRAGSWDDVEASNDADLDNSSSSHHHHHRGRRSTLLPAAPLSPEAQVLHDGLRRVVSMMLGDWHLPLRDACSRVVGDLDLLPLVLREVATMLQAPDVLSRRNALRVLTLVRIVTEDAWDPYLDAFRDDYLSIRLEACRTAAALALCHSQLLKELLNRLSDSEPTVRAHAVKAISRVATGPKVAFDILASLLGFLEHELVSEVKEQGCYSLVKLLAHCEDHVQSFAGAPHSTTMRADVPVPATPADRVGSTHQVTSRRGSAQGDNAAGSNSAGRMLSPTPRPLVPKKSGGSDGGSSVRGSGMLLSATSANNLSGGSESALHTSGTATPLHAAAGATGTAALALAALADRVRSVLAKWFTSTYPEDRGLRVHTERALVSLGVHVASLAIPGAASAESEVAAVVTADAKHALHRAVRRGLAGRAVGDLETVLALAEAGNGEDAQTAVLTKRVKQLGTRANVLRQLAALDRRGIKVPVRRRPSESGLSTLSLSPTPAVRSLASSMATLHESRAASAAPSPAHMFGAASFIGRPASRGAGSVDGDEDEEVDVDAVRELDEDGAPVINLGVHMADLYNDAVVDGMSSSLISRRRQSLLVVAPNTLRQAAPAAAAASASVAGSLDSVGSGPNGPSSRRSSGMWSRRGSTAVAAPDSPGLLGVNGSAPGSAGASRRNSSVRGSNFSLARRDSFTSSPSSSGRGGSADESSRPMSGLALPSPAMAHRPSRRSSIIVPRTPAVAE